ncbi:MAG: TonB-dependent receptor [Prevotellaceae bacterium]|nr:TonB-dependent receptor [Prevotellaceae bacterium]MDY3366165.1 TonB-dependent receptor [Prevotella sp.]
MKKKLFFAAALTSATVGYAVNPAEEKIDTLRSYQLQDVQVVSTRATKKTPMAFSNLNKQDIKAVNKGQDIPYLLTLTPSVTVTSDAGNGIGYTGIRVRGVDPSRINVTANGIPMNDAESAQVFWVNMGDFASSLQSLQLQRGVGTSTNGAGAFGASLNMQTENIGMQPFVGVDLSGGSYYSHKETIRFGTGLLDGRWGLQGRLSNIGSKGYIDRASTRLHSYFLQAGYFGDNTMVKFITFNGMEQTYHAWNYASKYEQSLYGRRYNSCGEYVDANGNTRYYDDQTDNYHQQHYQLHWDQFISKEWNFNAALHYTKGKGYYEEYKAESKWKKYGLTNDADMLGDLVRRKQMANDFYGVVASLNYNNGKGLAAHLGGGWNQYDGKHFGRVIWTGSPFHYIYDTEGALTGKQAKVSPIQLQPQHEYYRNKAKKTDANIYAKATWQFYKGLSAYADLQYRWVDYQTHGVSDKWASPFVIDSQFHFFNPKFGFNYEPVSGHRLYASYGISHKEPTRNIYEDNQATTLKAEKLGDWELGYQYQSKRVSAGINLYHMNYTNQFVLTGEINEIGEMIASNQNAGKSYRMGVELEAAWKPVDWFKWDANATFSCNKSKGWTLTLNDGEVVNIGDTPLSFTPDVMFNNIFTFMHKGLTASIQTQYIGEQYLTNSGLKTYTTTNDKNEAVEVGMMLDAVCKTHLNLSYQWAMKRWGMKEATIGCTIYNVFNTLYDNNGWADPNYRKNAQGKVEAYATAEDGGQKLAGFTPSAPAHVMFNVSVTF